MMGEDKDGDQESRGERCDRRTVYICSGHNKSNRRRKCARDSFIGCGLGGLCVCVCLMWRVTASIVAAGTIGPPTKKKD